jgi:hypothetical protein
VTWGNITLHVPQGPEVIVGLFLFGVIMLSVNIGLIVAMRYERRVR